MAPKKPPAKSRQQCGRGRPPSAQAQAQPSTLPAKPKKVAIAPEPPKAVPSSDVQVSPAPAPLLRASITRTDTMLEQDLELGVHVDRQSSLNNEDKNFLSGPCDCVLTCLAAMGDAVEGGAEQIVGLVLLPLAAAIGYVGYHLSGQAAEGVGYNSSNAIHTQLMVASTHYAQDHPRHYLLIDLGLLGILCIIVLFEQDLYELREKWRFKLSGYQKLKEGGGAGAAGAAGAADADEGLTEVGMRNQLRRATDATEELEFRLREHARSDALLARSPASAENPASTDGAGGVGGVTGVEGAAKAARDAEHEGMKARLVEHQSVVRKLQAVLDNVGTDTSSPDPRSPSQKQMRIGCWASFWRSTIITVFRRALNGLVTVWLFFADVVSDIEVMILLYSAGEYAFAYAAGALLIIQYIAVYCRVLPYLHSTYGGDSAAYVTFLLFGFPFGLIALDILMFLEPFGLLPIVPLPERMRQFVPAYKATRIIAEVLIESLPQCLLQSYILVVVTEHVRAHVASAGELGLMGASIDGATFAEILPRSITISSLTMLKTWIELVYSAREAGISVRTKAVQLWNVGYGLPLDALKKGTIIEWSCQYHLSDAEVRPLFDALAKNSSLARLNLAAAGLDWANADLHAGRSAGAERSGAPLIEALALRKTAALAGLQQLIIDVKSGFAIPVERLRAGGDAALAALCELAFFAPDGGPRKAEILLMADLLRKNRRTSPTASDLDSSAAAVSALIAEALGGQLHRVEWQARIAQLIVIGNTRAAHFRSVLDAEVMRCVGFGARELLDVGYDASALVAGRFLAAELRDAGFDAASLRALGYVPSELRAAGFNASDLKELGCTASELRHAAFRASELKAAGYLIGALRTAEYPPMELKEGGFRADEMRNAGITAAELRKAKVYSAAEMRDAKFTAGEMREGGFDAKRVRDAGYDAADAKGAGFSVDHLIRAGYDIPTLRDAGVTAPEMRDVLAASQATQDRGKVLESLQWAGYTPAEMQDAGFAAADLKELGTSLFALKQANTPIANLKEAGFKADRLKQQGYRADELWKVYTAKELHGHHDADTGYVGYSAKELHAAREEYSVEELKAGGYTPAELREGGYTSSELRARGFTPDDLKAGGFTAAELHTAGYELEEIRRVGGTADELKAVGLGAKTLAEAGYLVSELHVGGYDAGELKAAGFDAKALKHARFKPSQLLEIGIGAAELQAVGFGAGELRKAGKNCKELRSVGYDADELEDGGFTKREVAATDGNGMRWVMGLRETGYSASELRLIGFTAADLRTAGFNCIDMKRNGWGDAELRDGGFKQRSIEAVDGRAVSALRLKGYPAKELRGIGFSASELLHGTFPTKELKAVGYTAVELKAAGSDAKALHDGGFSAKELSAAGFPLRALREGGFQWNELVIVLKATYAELADAGFEGLDPKHRLFLENRPAKKGE